MNIKELIKEAHENAIAKGFYECSECGGSGHLENAFNANDNTDVKTCPYCKDGTDPNKNIGELLMLIISELGKVLEAYRCGNFAGKRIHDYRLMLNNNQSTKKNERMFFEINIKDTFEDKMADVFIRLLELCGYDNQEAYILHLDRIIKRKMNDDMYKLCSDNAGSNLFEIVSLVCKLNQFSELNITIIAAIFVMLINFCDKYDIPIEKHIQAKMAYNKIRPYKHGKEY